MASVENVLARYRGKTAATFQEEMPQDQASSERREIPKDHAYDPKSLKPLAKTLWAASVAMGHALTSYRHLTRLKSSTISPDGKLGGKGYVMSITDLRKRLYEACESLSAITDTLHDEICGPHWKPRLAQLDENDAEDVERFIEESKGILDNPEEDAAENEREIEEENDGPSKKSKKANSSIPVGTLPGPRVEHLDRELDTYVDAWVDPKEYVYPNPWGDNKQAGSSVPDANTDPTPTEAWDFGLGYGAEGQGAGDYANPTSEGKGVWGPASGLPGSPPTSSGDNTPTVERKLNDKAAAKSLADRFRSKKARFITEQEVRALAEQYSEAKGVPDATDEEIWDLIRSEQEPKMQALLAQSELPGNENAVARSDYYNGDLSGNLVNAPKAAAVATLEELHSWANSSLPSEAPAGGTYAPSLVNTDYSYEDLSTPYVRYDYTTHNYRKDPLHDWPKGKENG